MNDFGGSAVIAPSSPITMKQLFALALLFLAAFNSCKEKEGCTDPAAANFDPKAEKDDGSCIAKAHGCTDPAALNYDSLANSDDGSCLYDSTAGEFTLDFKALVNGAPLVMKDSVYKNVLDYYYKMETIRFYVSNLHLVKDDDSEILVKDVSYLDLENSHRAVSADGEKITALAPVGNYKGIRFAIGVDPAVNNGDPSVYPNDHPLSIFRNMHWTWADGYIFLKLEGKMDSVADGNQSLTQLFVYHCGNNPLYKEWSFTKDFSISPSGAFEYDMAINVDKIFYSSTDTLDARHEAVTHSEENLFALAERVMNLFAGAIENR